MSPAVAANVALALLPRYLTWGRWQDIERTLLDSLFSQKDVIAALTEQFRQDAVGPLATCLRYALRYPAIDEHLSVLAREAVQPAVRATAFECLVQGRASWPVGFGWEWVDKVYNEKKKIAVFESREITTPPLDPLIREGLVDRSVFVRRVAADALIANRRELAGVDELTQLLDADANPSIQERADYLRRHR